MSARLSRGAGTSPKLARLKSGSRGLSAASSDPIRRNGRARPVGPWLLRRSEMKRQRRTSRCLLLSGVDERNIFLIGGKVEIPDADKIRLFKPALANIAADIVFTASGRGISPAEYVKRT